MEIVYRSQTPDRNDRTREKTGRRAPRANDRASRDFDVFLQRIGVPLLRQVANALKAEGYAFTVFTPSGSVRLMSDRSSSDYIELTLDTSRIRHA